MDNKYILKYFLIEFQTLKMNKMFSIKIFQDYFYFPKLYQNIIFSNFHIIFNIILEHIQNIIEYVEAYGQIIFEEKNSKKFENIY